VKVGDSNKWSVKPRSKGEQFDSAASHQILIVFCSSSNLDST